MLIGLNFLRQKYTKFTKFKKVLLLVIIYALLLTLFPNDDFTGLIDLEREIKKKNIDEYGNKYVEIITFPRMLFERFYFALITAIGIGYGDVVPNTLPLKILNSIFICLVVYFTVT